MIIFFFELADYWKSQAKKYCEFCKCWLADNKPSIEFHEKGRKHQDNVARKLRTITKSSLRQQKDTVRESQLLRRMENAAMSAYTKDIESGADFSSKALKAKLENSDKSSSPWLEVASKTGPNYFWNTETHETVWEPPEIGYVSLTEQQLGNLRSNQLNQNKMDGYRRLRAEEAKQEEEEKRAAAEREKMKARRVVEEEPLVTTSGPILEPSHGPYGKWTPVEHKPKKEVDLQLPKQEEYIAITIPVEKPVPVKEFKEKKIECLVKDEDDEGSNSGEFKKRKIHKRNVRQRFEDND